MSFAQKMGPVRTVGSDVQFVCADFVTTEECPPEVFHAVVCLSTSKWIHLNHGDVGIKAFFSRVYRALQPGG